MFERIKFRFRPLHPALLLPLILLPWTMSCQNPVAQQDIAQISVEVRLISSGELAKTATIVTVSVTVFTGVFETESYEELVVEELAVSDRSAKGTISVPMGEDRTFSVRAIDANDFIQYTGRTNIDITEKTFSVEVGLKPIPPNRPTLRYSSETGFFSWQPSTALDFAAYRLYRAPEPNVTLSADLIYTTSAIDSTFYDDRDSLPEGTYYYRLFEVDTEGLVSEGSNEISLQVVG